MAVSPLPADKLYRRVDAEALAFETTDDISDLDHILGQDRALESIDFGTGIDRQGYNLFVLGAPGTGRHSLVREMLVAKAAGEASPGDWVYVNNFATPHRPKALKLPTGRGRELREKMAAMIDDLRSAIPAVFESDDYRARRQVIDESFKQHQEGAFEDLRARAEARGIALIQTPMGMAMAPIQDGEVIKPEAFKQLAEADRRRIQSEIEDLQKELQGIIQQLPRWEKTHRTALRELNREMAGYAIRHAMEEVNTGFADLAEVVSYSQAVEADLLENVDAFLAPTEGAQLGPIAPLAQAAAQPRPDGQFRRYEVNVLVDNSETSGAPVVYEDSPAMPYLVGRVEHISQMGALVTDFSLIKAGSLHRANGGYMIVDARKLLLQPFAWESLKRALRSGELKIELPDQMYALVSTISLEPEPIPLSVKVALIGERQLYYLLSAYDPDFSELFKVTVDFEEAIDWRTETTASYARLIAAAVRRHDLQRFDKHAVARVIEYGARLAEDSEKLSLKIGSIADLLREADYWARTQGHEVVTASDVQRAIDAQVRRVDRVRERAFESINRNIMLIDTDGAAVGQINGLSVLDLGNFRFGRPTRITARVRLGAGKVVDIEREVELGGPLHSKGVLILGGFLGARFASDRPLSLSASLVFEQSYGGVDGDSASSAELYALLSALAEAPIKQSLAVTGSVNQHGQVQAIGGVNEKIEGFFDICAARGLTGTQGVLVPVANVEHLMLRADIVEAARDGRFRIFPIEHIDQGIELLTGIAAGTRDGSDRFPAGSINQKVEDRLIELAEARRRFAQDGEQRGEAT